MLNFSSKISQELCKLEVWNLAWKTTMISSWSFFIPFKFLLFFSPYRPMLNFSSKISQELCKAEASNPAPTPGGLCVSVLRVASGPRVKLASCKSALTPPVVYSTDRSKAVVPVLVLLFFAVWFILRGDLLYVFPCVILFLCFSVFLVLRLPRLGKRELILVLFKSTFVRFVLV